MTPAPDKPIGPMEEAKPIALAVATLFAPLLLAQAIVWCGVHFVHSALCFVAAIALWTYVLSRITRWPHLKQTIALLAMIIAQVLLFGPITSRLVNYRMKHPPARPPSHTSFGVYEHGDLVQLTWSRPRPLFDPQAGWECWVDYDENLLILCPHPSSIDARQQSVTVRLVDRPHRIFDSPVENRLVVLSPQGHTLQLSIAEGTVSQVLSRLGLDHGSLVAPTNVKGLLDAIRFSLAANDRASYDDHVSRARVQIHSLVPAP